MNNTINKENRNIVLGILVTIIGAMLFFKDSFWGIFALVPLIALLIWFCNTHYGQINIHFGNDKVIKKINRSKKGTDLYSKGFN